MDDSLMLAKQVVSHPRAEDACRSVLRRCELKPHLSRTYKVSRDPGLSSPKSKETS